MRICAIGLRGIPDVMGGIETHCEHLYTRLAHLDDQLDIIVVGRSGYAKSGKVSRNVRVVVLWAPRKKALETLIHTPLAILYARLFLHPDVIHLHAVGPGFFAPLARLLGFRVIGTHHAADYDRPKWGRFGRWFLKTGERMLARYAEEVICVSRSIEAQLAQEYPKRKERFVTIRNGVPPAIFGDRPIEGLLSSLGLERGRYILCVGRLDPTKGFHDAIEAFRQARPPGMKLVIAGGSLGSDAYAAQLQKSAPPDVVFAGPRHANEVRTLYRNAALFMHPSYLEGFALVVLEALAANIPIVLTDIPPHIEVGLDGGSYYACGDVKHLASILADANYARLRCARRVEILEENDWDQVARRYRDILLKHVPGQPAAEIAAPAP
ncbi:MAG TPA: glycosyltransferase family 4 protein [Hyphomonadaceae bacterium]|nr:glycosyltransferase family 4 protein [Hyphomonadaceae bacterium]